MKKLLKNLLPHLAYFYSHLKYRMVVLVVTSILVGLLDGLGLTMFLPLLELVANQNADATSENLGNLAFILEGLEATGLSLSLTVVLITMLVFFILKGFAKFGERYLRVIYQQFFIAKIRLENIQSLASYDYSAFVSADAGVIQNTLSGEVERVMQAFRSYSDMLQQLVMILTYAALAFLASPGFAVLVVVGGVLSNFLFSTLYSKTKILSKELVDENHTFQGYLIQAVAFFKYLKATASMNTYANFLKSKILAIEGTVRRMGFLNSIMMGIREPLMIAIVISVILVQVNIFAGSLSTVILSLLFFYRGLTSLSSLQTAYNQFLGYSGSLGSMTEFMRELRSRPTTMGKGSPKTLEKCIELKNVFFAYSQGKNILKDISLKIHKNESLAIVGESGSGKSTLMNILCGLLTPTSGQVLLDGQSLAEVDIRMFQQRIGYITQEPVIFDDSVFNNVTLWSEKNDKNMDRFGAAMQKAHLLELVDELPEKEDSRVGINGVSLSGGQKQRISIARELYKEVDFLFMDEATSALDSETERIIQENIDQLKGQYTLLIIAHRLSTIKNADKVVVMKEGKIDQEGKYNDLINQSKVFKKMVELQEV